MMKRALLFAVGALVLSLNVEACTCLAPEPSPCSAFSAETVIFTGRVIQAEVVEPANEGSWALIRYRFRISESIAGINNAAEIDVESGPGASCGYDFQLGAEYLVEARRSDDKLYGDSCSYTRPLANAAALLPVLRAISTGRSAPSLFGIVRQGDPPEEEADESYTESHEEKPLRDTTVRVVNAKGNEFQTITDAGGAYSFFGLPSGTYTVSAGLVSQDPEQQVVKLPDNACHERNFDAVPSASIRGQLLDHAGKPFENAVKLVPVDASHNDEGREEATDEDGLFEFRHVAPGRYLLVFNVYDLWYDEALYPRTYFPGVTKKAEAREIEVREGQGVRGLQIRLGPPIPFKEPAPDALRPEESVSFEDGRELLLTFAWALGPSPDNLDLRVTSSSGPATFEPSSNEGFIMMVAPGIRYGMYFAIPCGPGEEARTREMRVNGSEESFNHITLEMTDVRCRPISSFTDTPVTLTAGTYEPGVRMELSEPREQRMVFSCSLSVRFVSGAVQLKKP